MKIKIIISEEDLQVLKLEYYLHKLLSFRK